MWRNSWFSTMKIECVFPHANADICSEVSWNTPRSTQDCDVQKRFNRATERLGSPQQTTVPIQKNENMRPMAALRLSAEYQVLSSFTDGGYTKDKPSPTRNLISRAPQNPLTSSRQALAPAALRPPTQIKAGAEKTSAKLRRAEKKQPKPGNPKPTNMEISPRKTGIEQANMVVQHGSTIST